MAIAYKSAGTGATTEASGGNLAPLCPAIVDANDILILHAYYEGVVTAPETPSGWTLIANNIAVETVGRHYVFAKLAVGTEDGATISLGAPAVTTMRTARIYSFSGWTYGTIAQNIGTVTTTTHATDPVMPNVTTIQAGHLAVALVFQADDNTMGSPTGVTGGTWTQRALYEQLATTPDSALAIYDCIPTANPGTISGGTISTANDPTGSIGFRIGYINIAPTTVLNSPADVATGVSVTPTLAFTGTDTESDAVEYEVEVDRVNAFDSIINFAGNPAVDKTSNASSGFTFLDALTPATDNFTIDFIEVFVKIAITGLKIGVFYGSGISWQCRSFLTLGNVGVGLQRFSGQSINIQIGEVLGFYYSAGSIASEGSIPNGSIYTVTDSTDGTLFNGNINSSKLSIFAYKIYVAQIKVNSITSAGFTAGHPFASGVQKEYTVQNPLTEETQYFWRVRAIDPLGSNTYGEWSTIRSFTTLAGAFQGILKRWNGSTWVKAKLKYWNGSTWAQKKLKRWNGSAWVEVDTTGL